MERLVGHTEHDIVAFVENAVIDGDANSTPCTICVSGRRVFVYVRDNVFILGDIIECQGDNTKDEKLWAPNSANVVEQRKSRKRIFDTAQIVVPGHGKWFRVPSE